MLPVWYVRDLAARGGSFTTTVDASPKQRHGRYELRILWALADPTLNQYAGSAGTVGTAWPHLQQVCRIERHRTLRQQGTWKTEVEVSYAITSLPPERAQAPRLLHMQRGHWGIENKIHHTRDVTFDEDRCQVRSGAAPQVLAATRNLVMTLLRRTGVQNVAAALRTNAGRPHEAVALICGAPTKR